MKIIATEGVYLLIEDNCEKVFRCTDSSQILFY